MKLSTRGRYAVRAMIDLAQNYGKEPVVLSSVARRQEISEQYLAHLTNPLKVAGLIKSVRGARGGFVLSKPPSTIRVSDIIRAVEGSTAFVECVDDPEVCSRAENCVARRVWVKAKEAVDGIFGSVTLEDMASGAEDMCCPKAAQSKSL